MKANEPTKIDYRVDYDHFLAFITIRGSDANALDVESVRAFCEALDGAARDEGVKGVVVSGADGNLTSGFRLANAFTVYESMPGGSGGKRPAQRARLFAHASLWWGPDGLFTRLLNFPKVVVAAVDGTCHEAGLYVALCADLVVATPEAHFGNPRWRYLGANTDLSLLVLTLGLRQTKRLLFTGKDIAGREAAKIGLVDFVVPREELMEQSLRLAEISVTQIPADGIVVGKYHLVAALQAMGVGIGFSHATMSGAVISNMRHYDGEFNYLRYSRDHGIDEAVEAARMYFGD